MHVRGLPRRGALLPVSHVHATPFRRPGSRHAAPRHRPFIRCVRVRMYRTSSRLQRLEGEAECGVRLQRTLAAAPRQRLGRSARARLGALGAGR
eukprot:4836359-Prymnesium_polylepis.1